MKTLFNSPRAPSRQFAMFLILLFLCLAWTALPLTAQQASQPKDQTQAGKESFGGSFKTLNPEQQKLVVKMLQAPRARPTHSWILRRSMMGLVNLSEAHSMR